MEVEGTRVVTGAGPMARAQHGGVLGDLHTLFRTGTVGGLTDVQLVDRFASRGDEAAFAALVARHGPMVVGVCRGVLRRPDDVEDAFQATFLILARKAGSLRRRESLGGWLHQVARRVAVQAATEAARRRAGEAGARAGAPEAEEPPPERPWDDVVPLLHEELARLPEKYRAPIVLCELESLTRDQAALQLGWPPGTVAGRLARGRALLRSRLSRRGVGAAAVAASLSAAQEVSAAVPALWVTSAFEAAAGTTPAGSVEVLVQEVLRAMIRSELRRIAMTTLTLGVALAAMAAVLAWAREEKDAEAGPTMPVTGLVVDPEGRPASGVDVFATLPPAGVSGHWGKVVAEARTDEQGRFGWLSPPISPGPTRRPGRSGRTSRGGSSRRTRCSGATSTPTSPCGWRSAPPRRHRSRSGTPKGSPSPGRRSLPGCSTAAGSPSPTAWPGGSPPTP